MRRAMHDEKIGSLDAQVKRFGVQREQIAWWVDRLKWEYKPFKKFNIHEMEVIATWYAVNEAKERKNIAADQAYLMHKNRLFYENFLGGMSPVGFGAFTGAMHKGVGLGSTFLGTGF